MRARVLALLVLLALVLPASPASAQEAPAAHLVVTIHDDRSEEISLAFTRLAERTEYRNMCLPDGASVTRVHDADGDLEYELSQDDDRSSVTFTARNDHVNVEMERPAASGGAAPFHVGEVNVCATQGMRVIIDAWTSAEHALFFVNAPGTVEDERHARWSHDGPLLARYAYESPLADDALALVEVAPFRMVVPADRVNESREVALAAGPAIRAAASEAALPLPPLGFRVHFLAQDEFAWEAGHYGGDGIVAVKPSVLDPDLRAGFPYVGAKVLVHEAFHAISAPSGTGDVDEPIAWWLEGAARRAERAVDDVLPDARRHCESDVAQTQCWFFDDRITRENLAQAYAPSFEFETAWEPSLPQSDDTRRFYYGLSEYLVSAYVTQAGERAYQDAWEKITRAFTDETACPCESGWLESTLLSTARNMTRDDLYRPWQGLAPEAFASQTAALVQAEQRVEAAPFFGLPIPGLGVVGVLGALGVALLSLRKQ